MFWFMIGSACILPAIGCTMYGIYTLFWGDKEYYRRAIAMVLLGLLSFSIFLFAQCCIGPRVKVETQTCVCGAVLTDGDSEHQCSPTTDTTPDIPDEPEAPEEPTVKPEEPEKSELETCPGGGNEGDTAYCKKCGTQMYSTCKSCGVRCDTKFCIECGASQVDTCEHCGAECDTAYCIHCGTKQ